MDPLARSASAWGHAVREGLRLAQWRLGQANRRRFSNDLDGIQHTGIDRHATLALHDHKHTTPLQCGYLRVALTGGVWSDKRLGEAFPDLVPHGHCRHCSTPNRPVIGTTRHVWWECPYFELIRLRHP